MKLSALVLETIVAEVAKQLNGGMTDDKREVQRLRDFHVAIRRATWVAVTDARNDTSIKCGICGAWECAGCLPSCVFAKYPREGKA
jgi:hypothetical protein